MTTVISMIMMAITIAIVQIWFLKLMKKYSLLSKSN